MTRRRRSRLQSCAGQADMASNTQSQLGSVSLRHEDVPDRDPAATLIQQGIAFAIALVLVSGLRHMAYGALAWVIGSDSGFGQGLRRIAAPTVLAVGLLLQVAWAGYLVSVAVSAVRWLSAHA